MSVASPCRRALVVCVFLTAVLASCGGADGDGDQAEVTGFGSPTATPVPLILERDVAVCTDETVEDEFGFMVTAEVCVVDSVDAGADDGPGPGLTQSEMLAAIPVPQVREQLASVLDALATVASLCPDETAWATGTADEAARVRSLVDVLSSDPNAASWTGSAAAHESARRVRNALVVHPQCRRQAGWESVQPVTRQAMADAAIAADVYGAFARGEERLQIASDFWFHADQIGHSRELVRLEAADPVDMLFMGSAAGRRAFDAIAASDRTARSAMSVALPNLTFDVAPTWWSAVSSLGVEATTVVVGYAAVEDFETCRSRSTLSAAKAKATSQAFAGLGMSTPGPFEMLVGDAATVYANPLAERYETSYGERGTTEGGRQPQPDGVERQLSTYEPIMAAAERCDARPAGFRALIGELNAQGIEVVVVSLPLNPRLTELNAAGRAAFQPVIDDYAAMSAELGATHLDLSDLIPAEGFLDLTHVTASSRTQVTEAVLAALQ